MIEFTDTTLLLICIALLAVAIAAGCVIGWCLGSRHGRAAGRIDGLAEARGYWMPRVIQATGNGARIATMRISQKL